MVASDHHLVATTVKMKLKKQSKQDTVRKIDVRRIKSPEVKARLVLALRKLFIALTDLNMVRMT